MNKTEQTREELLEASRSFFGLIPRQEKPSIDRVLLKATLTPHSLMKHEAYIKRLIMWKMYRRTGHVRDTVYDDVMEALMKAMEKDSIKALHGEGSIRNYIYKVVMSKCSNYFRQIERDKKRLLKEPTKPVRPEDDQYDAIYKEYLRTNNATMTKDKLIRVFMKLDLIKELKGDNLPI